MFEGKEITFIARNGCPYKAIVVACVKDVGISIVSKDNHNQFLYCLRMKNAPNFWPGKSQVTSTRKIFTDIRKGIIKGEVNLPEIYKKLKAVRGGYASAESCPFGQ